MKRTPLPFLCLTLALGACQSLSSAAPPSSPVVLPGQVLAQTSCRACHAIDRHGSSPNPNAPPFAYIANQEGLTGETLSYWLRGAHNYPSEMDFNLNEGQVNDLVAYMLTLRDPHYRRPPD